MTISISRYVFEQATVKMARQGTESKKKCGRDR